MYSDVVGMLVPDGERSGIACYVVCICICLHFKPAQIKTFDKMRSFKGATRATGMMLGNYGI